MRLHTYFVQCIMGFGGLFGCGINLDANIYANVCVKVLYKKRTKNVQISRFCLTN